jgi:hypothetical protein
VSTPTTRGFFGSAYFGSDFFVSDFFKERVTAPVPVPVSGTGGGGGGGFISGGPLAPYLPCEMESDIPWIKYRCRPGSMSAFAKAISKKIQNEINKESGGYSPADPLSVSKRISPDKIKEAHLRKLKERIHQLETEAKNAKAEHTAQAQNLQATVEELRKIVEDLQAKVSGLGGEVVMRRRLKIRGAPPQPLPPDTTEETFLEGVEVQDFITGHVLSAMLQASTQPEVLKAASAPDPLRGVWKLLGAAAIYYVSDKIQDPPFIRTVGIGAAVTLGISGIVDLVK